MSLHLLLVDQLICPRCGPEFGLVLWADKMKERRVLEGYLGCSNCRDKFLVVDGCADLRLNSNPEEGSGPSWIPGNLPTGIEIASLLGLTEGNGNVALIGHLASRIGDLSQITPNFEFVGISHEKVVTDRSIGVDRSNNISVGSRLPFRSRCFRGLVVSGKESSSCMQEVVRVLAPNGRLVVWQTTKELNEFFEDQGLRIVMQDNDIVVMSSI